MNKKSFIICFGPESTHMISLEKLGKKYEICTTSDISGVDVVFSRSSFSGWNLGVIDLSIDIKVSLLKKYIPYCGFPILFFSLDPKQETFVEELNKKFPKQKIMFCNTVLLDEKIEEILG